jgi:hypothetical protein
MNGTVKEQNNQFNATGVLVLVDSPWLFIQLLAKAIASQFAESAAISIEIRRLLLLK